MLKTMQHKLLKSMALAGGLGPPAVFAHGGVDAESGFLALAVHDFLHSGWHAPLALLGAAAAFAAVLFIARPGRQAPGGGPR